LEEIAEPEGAGNSRRAWHLTDYGNSNIIIAGHVHLRRLCLTFALAGMHADPELKNEDVRLLFETLRRLMTEKDYRRRDTTWYFDTRELIRVFKFDIHSRTHFAMGIALRALDRVDDPTVWDSIYPRRCRATHPQIEDCAVSVGLHDMVDDCTEFEKLTKFLNRAVSGSEAVPKIVQAVSQVALPFLESFQTLDDLRRVVHSERASLLTIRETAKDILLRS